MYKLALICLVAACIPPPGSYPSQTWPQQRHHDPDPYAQPDPYEDDNAYGGGYNQGGGYDQRQPSGGYDQRGSSGGTWLCTAEGSMGTAYGDGPWEYSTERAHGTGPTREAAAEKAYSDCNSLMTMAAAMANSAGKKRDGGSCTVSDCIGPGQR